MRFDGAERLGRHDLAARTDCGARVQLDYPLQLMNPDRAEALTPKGISQSHLAKIPAGRRFQVSAQTQFSFGERQVSGK
ncbi:MAG TPA: hypothetical protein VFG35_05090 [Actinoplanes sp.]|nr:hypothetical protein [Actinoplanes sp.]